MADEQVSELGRFVRRVCGVVPDYRGSKISYPAGLLILGILLAECAGRLTQDSKEIWFQSHWDWVVKLWLKYGGKPPRKTGTPSQSTISRLLSEFSEATFSRLVFQNERMLLWDQWDSYLADERQSSSSKKKSQPQMKLSNHARNIVSMGKRAPVASAKRPDGVKLM